MSHTAAVGIVGGGIIGASIAYHLARRGLEDVVVFEREEALGTQSTGKCAGGVRLQFSTPANVALSRISIEALERFEEEIGQPVDFRQNGYLFVLTDPAELETFRRNAERQRAMGVPVEVLTPEAARRIVPAMRIDDLVGATFCGRDGIASPHAILQGYARKARELGVRFLLESEVTAIEIAGGRVRALEVSGERWDVDWLVNAAGAWAGELGRMASLEVPVLPLRRMYFITEELPWVPETFPMLIDWTTGVYMHRESGGMLVGESNREEPPGFDQAVDWDFLGVVSEHAVHRVPRLAEAGVRTGVAGLYEVSPDHNAILGPAPELPNFICANGFSGHGMQHAPAVGLVIAEVITEGEASSADLTPFSLERFRGAELAPEHNVI